MTQQTLQLAFSVQGRRTAVGHKVAKKPVFFEKPCPKCGGLGSVVRNHEFILWFNCNHCGYAEPWKVVAAKIREAKACAFAEDSDECAQCPDMDPMDDGGASDMNYELIEEKYF
jgi:ribosomal protein S27AE